MLHTGRVCRHPNTRSSRCKSQPTYWLFKREILPRTLNTFAGTLTCGVCTSYLEKHQIARVHYLRSRHFVVENYFFLIELRCCFRWQAIDSINLNSRQRSRDTLSLPVPELRLSWHKTVFTPIKSLRMLQLSEHSI